MDVHVIVRVFCTLTLIIALFLEWSDLTFDVVQSLKECTCGTDHDLQSRSSRSYLWYICAYDARVGGDLCSTVPSYKTYVLQLQ